MNFILRFFTRKMTQRILAVLLSSALIGFFIYDVVKVKKNNDYDLGYKTCQQDHAMALAEKAAVSHALRELNFTTSELLRPTDILYHH